MKLIRFGPSGQERPGLQLDDGTRVDASAFGEDYDERFFGGGGLDRLRDWAGREASRAPRVADAIRLGPPIGRPSKIVCIGLNYRDHAAESGMAIPAEPVIFFKATTSIVGPTDDVLIPKTGSKLDWEVELAVVMGARANGVSRAAVARQSDGSGTSPWRQCGVSQTSGKEGLYTNALLVRAAPGPRIPFAPLGAKVGPWTKRPGPPWPTSNRASPT